MNKGSLGRRWLYAIVSAASLTALAAVAPCAQAEDAPIVGQISSDQAVTLDLSTARELPNAPMPQGMLFNRPTMPMANYQAAQRRVVGGKAAEKAAAPPEAPATALSLYFQTPSINETFPGNTFPPDGDIATSTDYTVQVVNFAITMYNLNTGVLAKQVNFATFFFDNTNFIFDPRIIFDPVWKRWVVMADGCTHCNDSGLVSVFKLAISQTADPTGNYFVYSFGPGTATGDFADFPQMGMDLNSIIFTYNDFLLNGNFDAKTFAVAKAYLYNGFGFSVPLFGGSGCTVAPPYVLDNHGPTFTLVACPGDNGIFLGAMTNTGLSNVALTQWQAKIPVTAYTVPPCAPQPGVNYCLDTGDSRFENRSLQVGTRILNVHDVTVGTATPRWYEFDTSTNTLLGSGIWFVTGTSTDWHASIVANQVGVTGSQVVGETFGTWMSVDSANNLNIQLRAIGGPGDTVSPPSAGVGAGIAVGPASATALTNQTFNGNRSGDYSYISLYPGPVGSCLANEFAILEGEVAFNLTNWGTRVGIVKHC